VAFHNYGFIYQLTGHFDGRDKPPMAKIQHQHLAWFGSNGDFLPMPLSKQEFKKIQNLDKALATKTIDMEKRLEPANGGDYHAFKK
jgi:hypothetical protein